MILQTSIINNALLRKGGDKQMRDTGYQVSNQLKQKFSQGGEKKVMKKSLSLLLAIAMVIGMFANMASAATPTTTQEKYDSLKAAGIFAGIGGQAALDQDMTRAQFARVIGLLSGLDVDAAPSVISFTDVAVTHWAYQEVEAVVKAGIMVGVGNKKFNPSGKVTYQEVAVAVAKLLGLKPVEGATVAGASAWAAGYIKAVEAAGFVLPTTYKAAATRAFLVEASFAAYTLLNTPKEIAVAKATQTGAKKITVEFNRALTAAEQTDAKFDVKNGLVPYPVTSKFAADGKSVALTATFLPAADYAVTVNKLPAVTVKVEDEKVTKLEIGATSLQKAANQNLAVKALNQFGEEVANALNDGNISAFSSVYGTKTVTSGKIDLSMEAVDTTIVVSATHPTTGLSATKTFKVVAASSATSIQLGAVVPLKDKTRISVSETGLVLPYTLADQYSQNIKLSTIATGATATEVTIDDIKFISSNGAIVAATTFSVTDGVLKFNTGTTAGTVVITAINVKTGAFASTTVKVEAAAVIKTFQVSNPGKIIVSGEKVVFPYVAADTFGVAIPAKDIPSSVAALKAINVNNFNITSTTPGIDVVTNWKANGELELMFTGTGTTTVYVWVSGTIASQLTVDVKSPATSVKITGTKDLKTTLAIGAKQTLTQANINVLDNYSRTSNAIVGTGKSLTIVPESGVSSITYNASTGEITALAAGTQKITVGIDGPDADALADAGTTFDIVFTVVANDKVVSFSIDTIGTIKKVAASGTDWDKAINVIGKTADGTEVAIVQGNFITQLTSSDSSIAALTGTSAGSSVYGVKAGTATVAAWKGGTKVAESTVTVSEAASVVTTLKFTAETASIVGSATTVALAGLLEAKDQYGVNVTSTTNGFYYSGTKTVADVNSTTGLVTEASATVDGQTVITFVSSNGLSATITVDVDN
jgi:hypothetical protein